MIVRMDGVMKSFYHQLLLTTKTDPDGVDRSNPVWHLAYKKPNYRLTVYRDKVIDTLKRSCTYEKYGLNYNDLMAMDIATFDEIRNIILDTDKALNNSNQAIANSISELNKPPHR